MGRPKRRQPLAVKDPNVPQVDEVDKGPTEEERMQAWKELCDEIDKEVEQRIGAMRAAMEERIARLQQELQVQLNKFPQCVQDMPVMEFQEKFGGNVEAVLRIQPEESRVPVEPSCETPMAGSGPRDYAQTEDANTAAAATTEEPSTRRGRRGGAASKAAGVTGGRQTRAQAAAAFATPSMVTPDVTRGLAGAGPTPGTARMPKFGEMLVSVNGSPIGHFGIGGITPVIGATGRFQKGTPSAVPQASVRMTRRQAAAAKAAAASTQSFAPLEYGAATCELPTGPSGLRGAKTRRNKKVDLATAADNTGASSNVGGPAQDSMDHGVSLAVNEETGNAGRLRETNSVGQVETGEALTGQDDAGEGISGEEDKFATITVETEDGETITFARPEAAKHLAKHLRPKVKEQLLALHRTLTQLEANLEDSC